MKAQCLWPLPGRALIISALIMLPASPAGASGLSLYEIATADVGLASAGWAARAQDPATLLKNPAGMSLLEAISFRAACKCSRPVSASRQVPAPRWTAIAEAMPSVSCRA